MALGHCRLHLAPKETDTSSAFTAQGPMAMRGQGPTCSPQKFRSHLSKEIELDFALRKRDEFRPIARAGWF